MFYIVALGNPGKEYERTRHNAAWLIMDEVFPNADWQSDRYTQALVAEAQLGSKDSKLVKPQTFMNLSGRTVAYLVEQGLTPENLIVVHDDIDLPIGSVRISYDSSAGGHNGVASITSTLGTAAYTRVRIGIAPIDEEGTIRKPTSTRDFVLKDFSLTDWEKLKVLAPTVKLALETIAEKGRETAMNKIN